MLGLTESGVVGITILVQLTVVVVVVLITRSRVTRERMGGQREADYKELAARYDALASQSASAQEALQGELSELRTKVESMERMLAEVG
ncbi:MAG TPA: hypothetical protein VIL17_07130 [Coriobacteriia bacterium]